MRAETDNDYLEWYLDEDRTRKQVEAQLNNLIVNHWLQIERLDIDCDLNVTESIERVISLK